MSVHVAPFKFKVSHSMAQLNQGVDSISQSKSIDFEQFKDESFLNQVSASLEFRNLELLGPLINVTVFHISTYIVALGSDCSEAQADLELHCPRLTYDKVCLYQHTG